MVRGGAETPVAGEFSKIFKRFLRKLLKMNYFSIYFKKTNKSAVLSGMIASPFGRVERAFHAARARMDLLAFPK